MKHLTHIILTIFLFFGCAVKNIEVLKYDQNTSYLVKRIEPLHVEIEEFNSREFMPWNIKQIGISKDRASWANFAYKKKANTTLKIFYFGILVI